MPEDTPINSDIDFPSLVRWIRTSGGLTQEQLAHELGVTFGTVNGWENGKHRPSPLAVKQLIRLAAELGLDVQGACGRLGPTSVKARDSHKTGPNAKRDSFGHRRKAR